MQLNLSIFYIIYIIIQVETHFSDIKACPKANIKGDHIEQQQQDLEICYKKNTAWTLYLNLFPTLHSALEGI